MIALRPRVTLSLIALLASACAGGAGPAPAPAPAPVAEAPRPAVTATNARADAPPPGWHRLDLDLDHVPGVGSDRALRELLGKRAPKRQVVVAVIDGGVDTAHALLRPNLWTNPREVVGNGKDDDNNGYVDDVHGWNMLGGPTGSINNETLELTRMYGACKGYPAGRGLDKPDAATCTKVAEQFTDKVKESEQTRARIVAVGNAFNRATGLLREALGTPSLTAEKVRSLSAATPALSQAQRIWLQLTEAGLDSAQIAKARESSQSGGSVSLDTMSYSRGIVGDTTPAARKRPWGNNDVTGPDAEHGTHVAGIIAAVRDPSGSGVAGIAPFARIMGVRVVPNGDERDEDIAAGIRYAVDNGATVINMSFGKGFSPGKARVDSAVRYAESKGVLLVHAAGNEGENTDTVANFPVARFQGGGEARTWLEVGARNWRGGADLPATFSNFGAGTVDLFAPGDPIVSTLPGGKTGPESGTSMAAPVVSGVAALLLAYFPELSPADVRKILMETTRKLPDLDVKKPGDPKSMVKFGTLSRTGGIVDAYAAVKAALAKVGATP
ncbi:MAG: S8 family serine peptidase [Gemmatimonadetes bacterium]|nr:S8 family serine peptidase [Gemmatimonadota bacterium]